MPLKLIRSLSSNKFQHQATMDFEALMAKEIAKKKEKANKLSSTSKVIKKTELQKQEEEEYRKRQLAEEEKRSALKRKQDEKEEEQQVEREKRAKFVERVKLLRGQAASVNADNTKETLIEKIVSLDPTFENPETKNKEELSDILLKLQKDQELQKEREEEENVDYAIVGNDIKDHKDKVYIQMRAYLKYLILEWQEVLNNREKNTAEEDDEDLVSRTSEAIYSDVTESLQPLFSMLRKKTLPDEVFPTLATLLMYLQQNNFAKANDTYISLSIGNAAWPIGINAVGIHERSALSKIAGIGSEDKNVKVANIAKDEKTRKWMICIKRLITFSEGYLNSRPQIM